MSKYDYAIIILEREKKSSEINVDYYSEIDKKRFYSLIYHQKEKIAQLETAIKRLKEEGCLQ